MIPVDEVEQIVADAGVPRRGSRGRRRLRRAQLEALKKALFAVALIAAGSLWFTRRLPGHPAGAAP